MEREIIVNWLYKALDLDLHGQVFIPGETKENCQRSIKKFIKELDILYTIWPEKSGTIKVTYGFRDSKHWIILERVTGSPLLGFVKQPTGELQRVNIQYNGEKEKRLHLMKESGLSIQEVEEIEGTLTEKEKEIFL